MDAKQRIARRVAQELRDGDIVNLGHRSAHDGRQLFAGGHSYHSGNRKTASSV